MVVGKFSNYDKSNLTCDGNARVAEGFLDIENVLDGIIGLEADGVGDEAILVLFDLADHLSLEGSRHVVVNDTEASKELW